MPAKPVDKISINSIFGCKGKGFCMKNISRREFLARAALSAGLGALSLQFLSACDKKKAYPLGVCDWTLGGAGNPKALELSKQAGLDGTQISSAKEKPEGEFFTKEQIAAYKKAMQETGMKIASTSPTCMNSNPFYSAKGAVEFTCSAIDAAAELGSNCILLPFYGPANMQNPDKTMNEKCFAPLVSRLKEVAAYAQKKNVMVSMENSVSAKDNLRIIDAVGSDWVNVYFDIFNFQYYGHDTLDSLKALKGHIGQMHLKDSKHKLDSNSGLPRKMDECLRTIETIGYEGWLVFELHGFNRKKDGKEIDTIRHNAQFIRKFYA